MTADIVYPPQFHQAPAEPAVVGATLAGATRRLSTASDQLADSMKDADRTAGELESLGVELRRNSEELREISQDLSGMMAELQGETRRFVEALKAN